MGFATSQLVGLRLKYIYCLTIAVVVIVSQKIAVPTSDRWSLAHSFSYKLGACRSRDWWDCPQQLSGNQIFNKSILYLKPHKTGSETFKEILLQIGHHYNLTTDKELDWKLKQATSNQGRRALLRNQYDILLRHSRYRQNFTEERIRGWNRELASQEQNSTAQRELLKIVTVRNPIDRLISHYFSQRRFRSFTPKRGFVHFGRLSEGEEISDFEEWLQEYKPSQQVFYNQDISSWSQENESGKEMLDAVQDVVDFYDHIIVTDQWRQSLCLFGFTERIHPSLLVLGKRNSNGIRARRFRTESVLGNRRLYAKVVAKIEYDFLLYHSLLKKYNDRLEMVRSTELGRYCDRVSAEAEAKTVKQ